MCIRDSIALDAARLAGDENYRMRMARQIATRLDQGAHVLACTSGADGAAVSIGASDTGPTDGRALAQACGDLLARVLATRPIKRLGIAGGDTSSHAVQALQAWGLSYRAPLAPGVALCRLHSEQASLDGLEIMLKGGQMGAESLFEDLLAGTI